MAARRPLNILIVTQYFWPENMRINDLVDGMAQKGHKVTVLTGIPNYPEGRVFPDFHAAPSKFSTYKGVAVVRVPMFCRGRNFLTLGLNYLSFAISASLLGTYRLRGEEFDVIFVYAVSPITAAIPAVVIRFLKRTPVFLWILDLWPETLNAVGVLKNQRALCMIGKFVSWIYNRVDYLLISSRAFAGNVHRYCTKAIGSKRIVYFPNWAEDEFFVSDFELGASSDLLVRDESVFTIVFAGNVGEAQDFPAILNAVEYLKTSGVSVRWVIVGDGRASVWLTENIRTRGLRNVLYLGRHPLKKMPALFVAADALLVSLKTNEVFARTIPGKVQAYLASGRPIIAMLDGEGARIIEEAQAGLVCASGDAQALASIVEKMTCMPKRERDLMGMAGRQFYRNNFSKQSLFDYLDKIFHDAKLRGRHE